MKHSLPLQPHQRSPFWNKQSCKKRTQKNPSNKPIYMHRFSCCSTISFLHLHFWSLLKTPNSFIFHQLFLFSSNTQNTPSRVPKMVSQQLKPAAIFLLVLNFCMYAIVLGIGSWAMNRAIDHGFIIGPGFDLPAHFSPIYFPMGNAATGFFVTFALIAGVVGIASVISGINHIRSWNIESLPGAVSAATIAWTLTLLAMGFAWKEINLNIRNARLKTMEAFLIILSITQLIYIAAIHGAASIRR